MAKGLLIALEGLDGSGTTTQGKKLAAALTERGHRVYLTAEPSTGTIGKLIRQALHGEIPFGEAELALLFAADRLDHLEREIRPQLDAGAVVLSDRYLLSSLAYQSVANPFAWIASINSMARTPELSILLRVSAETAAARCAKRGDPPERFDALERQRQVAQAYERASNMRGFGAIKAIDAEQSFDTVANELLELVSETLGARGNA